MSNRRTSTARTRTAPAPAPAKHANGGNGSVVHAPAHDVPAPAPAAQPAQPDPQATPGGHKKRKPRPTPAIAVVTGRDGHLRPSALTVLAALAAQRGPALAVDVIAQAAKDAPTKAPASSAAHRYRTLKALGLEGYVAPESATIPAGEKPRLVMTDKGKRELRSASARSARAAKRSQ